MSGNQKTIEVLLKLNDQMAAQLKVSTDAMERAAKASDGLAASNKKMDATNAAAAKGLGSLAYQAAGVAVAYVSVTSAIGALRAAVSSTIQVGGDFEQSLANTRAILQPTAAEFRALSFSAQELGRTTVFTAAEAGDAYTELGKLGFDTAQILASGNDVLTLAAAANLSMADAATAAATVVRQFGLEAGQTGEVVDIMAKAFSISALDAGNFSEAMQYVGPAAKAAGISVSEASAALGVLSDNGVKGSMAGTSLRRIIMELSNETSNASKVIREINPNAQTLAEKFEALQKAGIDNASATKLFRMEASTAAMILSASSPKVEEYGDKLRYAEGGAKGFAQGVAEIQLDTFQGDLKLAQSNLEGIQITLFEAFGPFARDIVQKFNDEIETLSTWVRENPEKLREWGRVAVGVFNAASDAAGLLLKAAEKASSALTAIMPESIEFDPAKNMVEQADAIASAMANVKYHKEELKRLTAEGSIFNTGKIRSEEDYVKEYTEALQKAKQEYSSLLKESEAQLATAKMLKVTKEVERLSAIISGTKKATSEGVKYNVIQERIAKAEAERIRASASGRSVTAKGAGVAPADASIDVGQMDDKAKAAETAARRANEQYTKLLRERELAELDADKKALQNILYFWDDAIALDMAGGSKHIAALSAMRQKAIDDFLRIDFESPNSTFYGRGVATGVTLSSGPGDPSATGGDQATNAATEAKAKADELRSTRYEAALQLQADAIEAQKSELQIENEQYAIRLELLKEFNLDTEALATQHNEKLRMIDMARLSAAANLMGGLAAIASQYADKDRKSRLAYKALAISAITIDTYVAASKAFRDGGGFPLGAINAAATVAYGLANINQVKNAKFEQGSKSTDASFGLVPGTAYYGDKVPAMLSSGERVLSRQENKEFERKATSSGVTQTINYSPVYQYKVSEAEKQADYNNFSRTLRAHANDPSFGRTQAALL